MSEYLSSSTPRSLESGFPNKIALIGQNNNIIASAALFSGRSTPGTTGSSTGTRYPGRSKFPVK